MQALENRIPPPIVTALFGLLMWLTARYTPGLAPAFSVAGVLSFRQAQTTVNPLKPETASALVRSGIYQYSRNPMYVGFALVLLAWACYLTSPFALFGVLGFVLYMNRFQIRPEERALLTLFGSEYPVYQTQVRRWL